MKGRRYSVVPLATAHVIGTLVAVAWCAAPHGIPHLVNLDLPQTSILYAANSTILVLWLSKRRWAVGAPWRMAASAFLSPYIALYASWVLIGLENIIHYRKIFPDIWWTLFIYLFYPYIVFHGYAASVISASAVYLLTRRQRRPR